MQLQIFSSRGKFVGKMLLKIKTCGKLLGFIITSCMQETAIMNLSSLFLGRILHMTLLSTYSA